MKRAVVMLLAFVFVSGFLWSAGTAQTIQENHYLVREAFGTHTFTGQIELVDQFRDFTTTTVQFDKFALPVEKNEEPMWNQQAHQTWWIISDPQSIWWTILQNQFGNQVWQVKDSRYLVLPATKNDPTTILDDINHYKCYDAIGPALDIEVTLVDQFGSYTMMVKEPVLFCNPVEKTVDGVTYPIINNEAHLACYRVEPFVPSDRDVIAYDQFGDWQITVHEPCWLCVPSLKLETVPNQNSTWGAIKSLYSE